MASKAHQLYCNRNGRHTESLAGFDMFIGVLTPGKFQILTIVRGQIVVTGFCGRRFRVTTEKLCTSDGFILGCFFFPLQLLTELLCVLWSFSAWQWRTCLGLRARNIVSIPNFRAPRIWLNGSGFGRTSTGKHPVASIEMSDFTFVVI